MEFHRVDQVWQLALVYEVRKANARDLNIPLTMEYDEEYLKEYHYLLLEDEGDGIATLRLNLSNEDYAKIERVGTVPAYQGQGLGKALIQEAEKWVQDLGYSKIVIHSKNSASGFYEKLGYQKDAIIELDYGPDGKRQVYYSKELDR